MSALVFQIRDDAVLTASDTLSLDAKTRTPRQHTDKVFPVPHASTVVTGTGIFDIVRRYYMKVLDGLQAETIDDLNEHAPHVLRRLDAEVEPPDGITTTVFHFGYSPTRGGYVGYQFHSGWEYEPHRIEHSFAAKPAYDGALDGLPEDATFPETARHVISNLKEIDDRKGEKRLGIGGDVQLRIMEGHPCSLRMGTIHTFQDDPLRSDS